MAYKLKTHYPESPEKDEYATARYSAEFSVTLCERLDDTEGLALFGTLLHLLAEKFRACWPQADGGDVHVRVSANSQSIVGVISVTTGEVSEGDWGEALARRLLQHFDAEGNTVQAGRAEARFVEQLWDGEIVPIYDRACNALGIERPISVGNVSVGAKNFNLYQC